MCEKLSCHIKLVLHISLSLQRLQTFNFSEVLFGYVSVIFLLVILQSYPKKTQGRREKASPQTKAGSETVILMNRKRNKKAATKTPQTMSIITCSHRQENLYVLLLSTKWQNWSVQKSRKVEGKILSQLMSANAQARYKVTCIQKGKV